MSYNILSIVSEYNPLHNGHLYHLEESIKLVDPDVKVAIISGNFVQRGEPAILDKWHRAELALKAGFDLVVELPCLYAISSAENFANGAMKIANAINSSFISFGSECGDLQQLKNLSKLLIDNEDIYISLVKKKISEGFSYPKSQELAIDLLFGSEFKGLCKPNNILGLEYLKSLNRLHSSIVPITIERKKSNLLSSSDIRKLIRSGSFSNLNSAIPNFVFNTLSDSKNMVLSLKSFEKEIFYILRTCDLKYLENIPDIPNNMITNLKKSADTCNSLDDLISNLKNKSITQARIQRILIYILLGITKNDILISKNITPYIRILGMNNIGKKLLPSISKSCSVVTSVKNFDDSFNDVNLLRLLEIDKRATDIYTLAYASGSKANLDYTTKIVTLDN